MSTMPAVRGVTAHAEIHAVSRPARTFTGDFYFTHWHDERLWIALGDVAGKGLPAAVVMAMIQEELEQRIISCAAADCDPSRTMQRLHDFLLPLLPTNRFATAVIGWLDADGTLTLANGGHCPPLLLRADGGVEQIASTGPILGILPAARWSSVTTRLAHGDALVLYTDGLDVRTPERRAGSAEEIAAEVMGNLAPAELHDDKTLLVIRRV